MIQEGNSQNPRHQTNTRSQLRKIAKNTDIFDPIKTKKYITNDISLPCKNKFEYVYDKFCQTNQIPYDKTHWKYESPIPLIPTTENVNIIINSLTHRYYTPIAIMAEIAVEGEELSLTSQEMMDKQTGTISIRGTKGHDNGTYTLSEPLAESLRLYLAEHTEEYPFPIARQLGDAFRWTRNRRAKELNKPELRKIPLKNLRNYAGAIYYLTMGKDPIQTKNFMRHKRLEQTMNYLRGLKTITAKAKIISKLTSTPEETMELLTQGFKEETVFYRGTPNEKHILTKTNI